MSSSGPLWPACGPIVADQHQHAPTVATCYSGEQRFLIGAGDGNRTRMTSLEGWGSTIELRPRGQSGDASAAIGSHRVSYRPFPQEGPRRLAPGWPPGCRDSDAQHGDQA